jgi:uncharacterized membrane protein
MSVSEILMMILLILAVGVPAVVLEVSHYKMLTSNRKNKTLEQESVTTTDNDAKKEDLA